MDEPSRSVADKTPTVARGTALVLVAAVLFGTTGTARALGPAGTDPLAAGAARLVVGSVALLTVAFVVARRRAHRSPASLSSPASPDSTVSGQLGQLRRLRARPARTTLLVLAGLATAAYQGAFFSGVARTGVAVGTVVALGSGPVFTGLAGRWVEGRAPPRRWYGSTVLAVAGGALIASGSGTAQADVLGLAAALGAGAAYATYTLASKRLLDGGLGPNEVAAGAFTIGAILSLPLLAVRPVAWLGTGRGLAVALFLGIFPTAVAYLLFGRGLQILSGAVVTTLTLAEPATAVVLGALVLGERPGRPALAGMTLVLAGIAALALPGVRDRGKLRGPTGRGRRRGCR